MADNFNNDDYLQLLKNYFPDQKISLIDEGWSSIAFAMNNKIIRIPKKGIERYRQEQQILQLIKNHISVAVPQTEIIEKPEFTFVIHTKIEGNKWSLSTFQNLSETAKQNFAEDIATFFAELHALPTANIEETFRQNNRENTKTLAEELALYELKEEQIDLLQKMLKLRKEWCKERVLVYTDFHADNCVVDENHRLCGLFDFADVKIADYHYDFRRLYRLYGDTIYERVIQSYEKQTKRKINRNKVQLLCELEAISVMRYFSDLEFRKRLPEDWERWSKRIDNFLQNLPERFEYFSKCRQEEASEN